MKMTELNQLIFLAVSPVDIRSALALNEMEII